MEKVAFKFIASPNPHFVVSRNVKFMNKFAVISRIYFIGQVTALEHFPFVAPNSFPVTRMYNKLKYTPPPACLLKHP